MRRTAARESPVVCKMEILGFVLWIMMMIKEKYQYEPINGQLDGSR